ncbi:hypothetical protein NPS01_25680 [Nocardioides psychrotolerans]|uniref:Endonuclease/Exonuclease/phosphatase family protein n=1 Tax=Nocardioides psychrotolerans TaxID=1005945 RepID=A0A1I3LS95_9ACTN|nr:endonuclease/exonuclease/phosphatase family protein [Nocardioides psychrotolerans]GEP38905.1 hypothetical protein NPS01_25680 [Nocardioides psychrotolerans]SFI87612.1 Endonuclease/Exonuclease/phosphatase family protein [Nocardioides psychrotolerans]
MTVYRVANLTYQWGNDARLIRQLADGANGDAPADVLLLVEARDADNDPVDVAKILPGWDVSQDRANGARAGSVIAVRRGAGVRRRWTLSRLLSRRGRKVQDRYRRVAALRDHGITTRVAVIHNPLPSTGRQADAVESTRRWVDRQRARLRIQPRMRWGVTGDFNLHHAAMRTDLDAPNSYGADVMGFVYGHGWGDVKRTHQEYDGTDHAVLTLTTKENR